MTTTTIKPQDWLDRGYLRREIPQDSVLKRGSEFLMQKAVFTEDVKLKYMIYIYAFERSQFPDNLQDYVPEFSYMATTQIALGPESTWFDIDINAIESIDQVENYFEKFWTVLGSPLMEIRKNA